jgi:hypothetical protein
MDPSIAFYGPYEAAAFLKFGDLSANEAALP